MTITIITNDPPYGTERTYNALRLALTFLKDKEVELRLFLMADAVTGALKHQETPSGYYNIERMIKRVVEAGTVRTCITCMKARGVRENALVKGVKEGDMALLAEWIRTSDRVISF